MNEYSQRPVEIGWFEAFPISFSTPEVKISAPGNVAVEIVDTDRVRSVGKNTDAFNNHVGVLLKPTGSVWADIFMEDGERRYHPVEGKTVMAHLRDKIDAGTPVSLALSSEIFTVSENLKKDPYMLKIGELGRLVTREHYHDGFKPVSMRR